MAADPFAAVLAPALAVASERIHDLLADVAAATVGERVRARLGLDLTRLVTRTVVVEFHRFRADGGYEPRVDSDVALRDFIGRQSVLARYPVLQRRIDTLVEGRVAQLGEVIRAFTADRTRLLDAGLIEDGALTDLDFGHGDSHDGGRHVVVLTVGDTPVVYKPRGLEPDRLLAAVVAELDCAHDLVLPRCVGGDGYGWQQFVAPADVGDTCAGRRFHRRLGLLLAVFSALGSTDMHVENIVAAGEFPVPIDVETLLHPPTESESLASILSDGPFGTGMLPSGSDAVSGTCIAGISAAGRRDVAGTAAAVPDHVGTDALTLVPRARSVDLWAHRPHRDGRAVPVSDHVDDIVAGYHAGVTELRRCESRIHALLDSAAAVPFRRLLRPTTVYGAFLDAATHPQYLADDAETVRLFGLLTPTTAGGESALAGEQAALRAGDVPRFAAPAGDAGPGAVSALARAHRALTRTVRTAPVAAEHIVRSALAGVDVPTVPGPPHDPDLYHAVTQQNPLHCAARVSRRVAARAVRDHAGAPVATVHALGTGALVATDSTLYHGGGEVLTVAALAAVLGTPVWQRRARAQVDSIVRDADTAETSPSPYTGTLGNAWLLRETAVLTDDPVARCASDRLLLRVLAIDVDRCETLDVMSGLAGAAALLADESWGVPHEFLERCSNRLAQHLIDDRTVVRGLAHGVDGVAWALGRVDHALGRTDHRDLLQGILDRTSDVVAEEPSWCWGAAGRAMAHAELADLLGDRGRAVETGHALADREYHGVRPDDSLCHGDAGIVLALRHLGVVLDEDDLTARARERSSAMAERITAEGYATGHDHHVGVLTFMTGVPGIAYARLMEAEPRLANPIALTPSWVTRSEFAGEAGTVGTARETRS